MKYPLTLTLAVVALISSTGLAAKAPERTPQAQAALDKALAGRTAGKPESCISLRDIRSSRIIDRYTILFEGIGGRMWRNDPPHGCAGLSPNRAILTKSSLAKHCRGDIFQIIDPPTPMTLGSCAFGDFVPYSKAVKKSAE